MPHETPSEVWREAPGCSGAEWTACLHTADLTCCNTYVLRLPSCFLVIDPGGMEDHANEVCALLADGSGRPVVVLLTHVHRDHARALLWMKKRLSVPCFYLAHESGTLALERGDAEVSASFIYGEGGIHCAMDGALLGAGGTIVPPELTCCRFGPAREEEHGGGSVWSQQITVDGETITAYHTPGHTDCSVCYLVGRILFCGDILFAHKPVVAGLPGWSPENLADSLRFLDDLLASGRVELVWSGHGKALDAATARSIAATVMRETTQMGALVRLDVERVNYLRECAVVFMREVGAQLVAQGGRLARLAGALAEWEETDLANRLHRDVDMDAIDAYLEEFHAYEKNQADALMQTVIPMKGVELIRKIRKVMKEMALPGGIGALYLFRLEFLLNDYIALMLGVDLRRCACETALRPILNDVLRVLKPEPMSHDALADLAEDPAAFGVYLANRLEEQARRSTLTVEPDEEPSEGPVVLAEPSRLSVLLGDVLERVLSGAERHTVLRVAREGDLCVMALESRPPLELTAQKRRFYELFLRTMDGVFSMNEAGVLRFGIPAQPE